MRGEVFIFGTPGQEVRSGDVGESFKAIEVVLGNISIVPPLFSPSFIYWNQEACT